MLDLAGIDAIILAGGFGTRLRSVLPDRQKVVADVSGKPFIDYLLRWLYGRGASRIILAVGYHADQVSDYLAAARWERFGLEVLLSTESEPLGTGGAARLALAKTSSSSVLVMNGDSFSPIDLASLIACHVTHAARVTLALCFVEDISRYGAVTLNQRGEIVSFSEKPGAGKLAGDGLINAGIYLFDAAVIEAFPRMKAFSLERDFFPDCIGNGLFGVPMDAAFIDMGVPETYTKVGEFLQHTQVNFS